MVPGDGGGVVRRRGWGAGRQLHAMRRWVYRARGDRSLRGGMDWMGSLCVLGGDDEDCSIACIHVEEPGLRD